MRYRWIDSGGVPTSPQHRTLRSAVRWIERSGEGPAILVRDLSPARVDLRRPRRMAPLGREEKSALVALRPARLPVSARKWWRRQEAGNRRRTVARMRTEGLTTHLRTRGTR